jgi:FlaG/FlaF family flagellin (archaellin)
MKGVSAVIAIILILMIVVALAALAYTWFTGIFASLTQSTGTAVTQTTTGMGYAFTIENAWCDDTNCPSGNDCVRTSVRNTGTEDIDAGEITIYIDGNLVTDNAAGTIPVGEVQSFNSGDAAGEVTCGTSAIIKVTIGTGLEQTAQIT